MSGESYVIKLLEAGDFDCPRNVAFVEAGDTAGALREMFQAVQNSGGTVNAAVWCKPVPPVRERDMALLTDWCAACGVTVTQKRIRLRGNFRALSRLFNKAAAQGPDRVKARSALRPLENHIRERLKAFQTAFPDKDVRLTISASCLHSIITEEPFCNPHVDGGSRTQERFIETLAGGATCLVDNEQVEFGGRRLGKIRLKTEKAVLWQVPTGALTLLTSLQTAEKPIMHTKPPPEAVGQEGLRVVVIYDLTDRKHSFWSYLPGFRR